MSAQRNVATGRDLLVLLTVVVVSLLISLLLAEAFVRLAGMLGLVDLTPTLQDLALVSGAVVPEGLARQSQVLANGNERPLYISDPVLQHRMAPNWSGYFPEEMMQQVGRKQVAIRTNSMGLRGPEIALPKPEGVFRILILGDSVTFGWGVPEEATYPSQLATLLALLRPAQHYEVINAGVSGYGTWQELLWLQSVGLQLEPDLLIVQVHLNDAADNLWGSQVIGPLGSAEVAHTAAGDKLLRRTARSGDIRYWLRQHSELMRLVNRLLVARQASGQQGSGTCGSDWKEDQKRVCWESTLGLLAAIQEAAAAHDVATALLLSPMRWQVEPDVQDPRAWVDSTRYQAVLAAFGQQRGLVVVDPLPAFRLAWNKNHQPLFLNVGHPNEVGQHLIAQELYNELAAASLLPPP